MVFLSASLSLVYDDDDNNNDKNHVVGGNHRRTAPAATGTDGDDDDAKRKTRPEVRQPMFKWKRLRSSPKRHVTTNT